MKPICIIIGKYRRSSDYDGLDLRCFEVTNAQHKNIKDNNNEALHWIIVIKNYSSSIQPLWAH